MARTKERQTTHHLPRRSFLLSGAAAWSYVMRAGFLLPMGIGTAAAKESPTKTDKAPLTLKSFMEISRYFTENETLKPEVGEKILQNLQSSPIHRKNLTEIHLLLKETSSTNAQSPTEFSMSHGSFQATIQDLLTAWYVGHLDTGKRPVLFTYYDAQMYRAVAQVQNIPATCGGQLNFWATPPTV